MDPRHRGIERGDRNPTVIILDKIARAMKIPAGQLLQDSGIGGEDPPSPLSAHHSRRTMTPRVQQTSSQGCELDGAEELTPRSS